MVRPARRSKVVLESSVPALVRPLPPPKRQRLYDIRLGATCCPARNQLPLTQLQAQRRSYRTERWPPDAELYAAGDRARWSESRRYDRMPEMAKENHHIVPQ